MLPQLSLSPGESEPYTISHLVRETRAVLEAGLPVSIWVRGEISNLSCPSSGHLYFTLKDEAAQVRCALFRPIRLLLPFKPQNGQQVLARVRVTLYEPRGEFQLRVEYLEPAGEGALRLAFDLLKQRLAAEGLFDPAHKRPLPPFPRQVGLITSATGAAVHDLLTVFKRRFPALPLVIYPALVQGEGAPASLIQALELANARAECDVLILARGGGSAEDLAAFNDEGLARAIRASRIPIVTGIGHEIDITIADFAADRRAPTPSAAAELVAPSAAELAERLAGLAEYLILAQARRLDAASHRLESVSRQLCLLHPSARLNQQAQRLDRLELRLQTLMRERLAAARGYLQLATARLEHLSPAPALLSQQLRLDTLAQRLLHAHQGLIQTQHARLSQISAALAALSPLKTLERGYAIVQRLPDGQLVRDPGMLSPGDRLLIRLAGGAVEARVLPNAEPGP